MATGCEGEEAKAEICNGKDDNCDGEIDEGLTILYFKDSDLDGYGVARDSKVLCNKLFPYIAKKSCDCDDGDQAFYPGRQRSNQNNVETCQENGEVKTTQWETSCKDGKCVAYMIHISAGSKHTYVLKKEGSVWCWGNNIW